MDHKRYINTRTYRGLQNSSPQKITVQNSSSEFQSQSLHTEITNKNVDTIVSEKHLGEGSYFSD